MQSLGPYRLVHFVNPDDFVQATAKHDDSFMNFSVGALLDSLDPNLAKAHERWGGGSRTLLGVYRGAELITTVTKIAKDFSWIIASPRGVTVDDTEIPSIVRLFVSFLPTVIDPKFFDKLIGPVKLVDAMLECWVSHMAQNGLSLKLLDPYFRSKVTYATINSIPEPSPAFAAYKISQAGAADVEALAHLYVQFTRSGPIPSTVEDGRAVMADACRVGHIWVCREEDTLAGYTLVGRISPHTIAIKNVFTDPSHRRKGVAEAMVRAVTRYYLGAIPRGFDGGPEHGPIGGVKEEICLNVATDEASRLYKRTGFLLNVQDPVTGKEGWYPSCWRGVEVIQSTAGS